MPIEIEECGEVFWLIDENEEKQVALSKSTMGEYNKEQLYRFYNE